MSNIKLSLEQLRELFALINSHQYGDSIYGLSDYYSLSRNLTALRVDVIALSLVPVPVDESSLKREIRKRIKI